MTYAPDTGTITHCMLINQQSRKMNQYKCS